MFRVFRGFSLRETGVQSLFFLLLSGRFRAGNVRVRPALYKLVSGETCLRYNSVTRISQISFLRRQPVNNSVNPLGWKFSIGTWFTVQVFVSVFFPLAILAICLHFGWRMGGMISGLLFVSVLLHEFGHIVGARLTGGDGDEILIWPLGGLAMVSPGNNVRAKVITAAAGPAVNLLICGLFLPFLFHSAYFKNAFIPWQAPISIDAFAHQALYDNVVLLGFHLNFMLLTLNLLPAIPLDGGQILRAVLVESMGNTRGSEWAIKTGLAIAILLALAAILGNHTLALSFTFLLFIAGMLEFQRLQMGEHFEDSTLGYDFSQGYSSLERSEEKRSKQPGFIARWKAKRLAEKQRREEIEARQNELQVDAILAKLHAQGIESLSESEKRQLKQASSRLKGKERDTGDV